MFGRTTFAAINAPLNSLLERGRPLVAVHRGTGQGSVPENTLKAMQAAVSQGADIVELDVISSTDGQYFCFHDGYEPMAFGIQDNLHTLSSVQIDELSYRWFSDEHLAVERLATVLDALPQTFINIDRSWHAWPALLTFLDSWDPSFLLLKSPANDEFLDHLTEHPVKYPYIPIVHDVDDVERALARQDVNVVGVELIARTPGDVFCDADYIAALHDRGVATFVNALVLADRVPLFAGWDDERSVFEDPDQGHLFITGW